MIMGIVIQHKMGHEYNGFNLNSFIIPFCKPKKPKANGSNFQA